MSQFDSTYRDEGGAGRHAAEAGSRLKEAGAEAGSRLKEAGKEAVSGVGEKLRDEAEHQRARASDSINRIADELDRAARVCSEEDAWAEKVLSAGAASLKQASGYLSGLHLENFVSDSEDFARRNPAAYLGASIAAGFILARIGKAAAARAHARPGNGGVRFDDDYGSANTESYS